jgi:hypothetical protein
VLALGLVVAAGTVFVAWTALAGGVNLDLNLDWDSFREAEPEERVATRTPRPTEVVTPSPTPGLPAVSGSPFSLAALENAWKAKGMTLFSEGGSAGFSGTAVTPNAVRAQRGTETAQLAVLIYPSSAVVKQDWNLSSGQAPSPVGGRTVPANESIWWNQNVVVVLLSGSGAVGNDAKSAFLAL